MLNSFFFWIRKVRGGEDLQEELDPVALLVLLCWFLYGWPQRRVLLRRAYLLSSVGPLWASILAMYCTCTYTYIILYFGNTESLIVLMPRNEKWEKEKKRGWLWKIVRNMRKKVKLYWNHLQDGYSFALRDSVLHACCSQTLSSCCAADPLLRRQKKKPARRKKKHSCPFCFVLFCVCVCFFMEKKQEKEKKNWVMICIKKALLLFFFGEGKKESWDRCHLRAMTYVACDVLRDVYKGK